MFKKVDREINRQKKHSRIRARITGTPERPRLSVFRSLENISVQVIDDVNGVTLVSASTIDKEIKPLVKNGGNTEAAVTVGKKISGKSSCKEHKKCCIWQKRIYLYWKSEGTCWCSKRSWIGILRREGIKLG